MKLNPIKLAGLTTAVALTLSLASAQAQNSGPNNTGLAGDISGNFASGPQDAVSASNPTPFGSGATGYANFQAWQITVANAYSAGTGGVWNSAFHDSTGQQADSVNAGYTALWTDMIMNYGVNKTLTLSVGSVTGGNGKFQSSVYASANASSGYINISPNDGGSFLTTAYTLNLALSGSGLAPGEMINSVAFMMMGRSGAVGTVTWTATYSDATTSSLTIGSALGVQGTDSFFEFNAPAGQSIVSVAYSSTTSRVNPFDDFSFTTVNPVPEPGVMAISILGGCGLLFMRHLRRKA